MADEDEELAAAIVKVETFLTLSAQASNQQEDNARAGGSPNAARDITVAHAVAPAGQELLPIAERWAPAFVNRLDPPVARSAVEEMLEELKRQRSSGHGA